MCFVDFQKKTECSEAQERMDNIVGKWKLTGLKLVSSVIKRWSGHVECKDDANWVK